MAGYVPRWRTNKNSNDDEINGEGKYFNSDDYAKKIISGKNNFTIRNPYVSPNVNDSSDDSYTSSYTPEVNKNSTSIFDNIYKGFSNIGNNFMKFNNAINPSSIDENDEIFGKKSWSTYKTNNPNTPGAIKPIGYALESPFRIPAVNRLFSSASKIAGGENAIADNAPINTYSTDTRNSVLNKSADILGGLVGFGLSPRVMGYNGGDANIFKAGNNVAEGASTKLGTFIKTPIVNKDTATLSQRALSGSLNFLNKATTTLSKGAIDGGLGNLAYDIGQNKDINELPKSALYGSAGGAALFGVGGLASGGSKLSKMATSKLDEAINNIGRKTEYTPQEEALISKGVNTLDNIETPVINNPSANKINIINPKGMNFNQTTFKTNKANGLPGYETTIPIENRTAQNVGARNVKAISYEYGELKPHVQQAAAETLTELENSTKGTRTAHYDNITGETIVTGTKKNVSSTVKNIQDDTGLSYDKIRKGLEDIIEDHGKENNAASKKIELSLDHRLTYGATDELGNDIPPVADYILTKADIEDLQKGQLNVGQVSTRKSITQPQTNNINSSSSVLQKNFPVGSKISFNANMGRGKGEVIGYKTDKWGNEWVEIDTGVKSQTGIGTIKDFKRVDDDIKLENGNQAIVTKKAASNSTAQSTNNLNPSIGATDRKNLMVDIVTGNNKEKKGIKSAWDNFYTHVVDTNNPIKKVDDNTYTLATNSKKVGGTVSHILHENLVDMQGNKLGEGLKSIAKDIPANEEVDFFKYVLQKHNIDRAREGKPVDPSFTSEQSVKAIKLLDKEHPEYKALGDRLTKFVNDFEKEWGNKSGLISDDLWSNLQNTYKNYLPTNREFSELEEGITRGTNGRGFVDQTTPINKATGSDRNIINPVENIANLVNRTVRTARYNEVGQNLVTALKKNPQELSKYAEIVKGQVNSNAKNIVTVLENGKPVNVKVNDINLLEALQGLYKTIELNGFENKVKTFNNVFKSLITTKNPFFAIRNVSRDIPTAYINGSEGNPFKFLVDLVKAGKDIVTNSDVAQKYKALGGESSNFFNPNEAHVTTNELMNRKLTTDGNLITGSKPFNPITKGLKKVGEKVEAFNNLTESAPRLAEFKRTLNKTGDAQKALYNSGEVTTNFSRGGDITKKLDIGVPYLNAGVQGLDKLARQFKNKPIATILKGATSVTAPALIMNYVNKDNENYKQLDNRTKDNYYLFPRKDGTFIKIPKSREFGVIFGSLAERTLRKLNGEEEAFKGFGSTVATNFSPANPIENNIASPIIGVSSNKDFAGRAIVPQAMLNDNRSPYLQYDENSTVIAKGLASAAKKANIDLSPKQVDYIVKSYTGVIAQLAQPMLTESALKGGKGMPNVLDPIKKQFTADPAYSNQSINDFYENMAKAKRNASDRNILENIDPKTKTKEEDRVSAYTKANKEINDIEKELRKAQSANDEEKIKTLRKKMADIANRTNKNTK